MVGRDENGRKGAMIDVLFFDLMGILPILKGSGPERGKEKAGREQRQWEEKYTGQLRDD